MHYQRRSRGGSFPLGKIFLGIVIPLIVVMGAIRIYNNYDFEIFEPEHLHQRAITKLADKLVVGVAVPEWQDVRLIYASVEFAEDLQTAYANIAYRYSEGSLEKSVQFPVKLVLIQPPPGEKGSKWEVREIGVFDLAKLRRSQESDDYLPAEVGDGTRVEEGSESEGEVDSEFQDDWNKYRWFSFDKEKHLPIMRGKKFSLDPYEGK